MATITHEIKKHLETLSTAANGWTTELNMVSWNGGKAKFDIRSWSPDKARMSKGITLDYEEAVGLFNGLADVMAEAVAREEE